MDDKRNATRRRVLKAGKILFDGAAIDCTVRNVSPTGAALDVESHAGMPEVFSLLIEADGLKKSVRVVWRRRRLIGVRFDNGNESF